MTERRYGKGERERDRKKDLEGKKKRAARDDGREGIKVRTEIREKGGRSRKHHADTIHSLHIRSPALTSRPGT